MHYRFVVAFVIALLVAQPGKARAESHFAPLDGPIPPVRAGEIIYVPAYSYIYARGGKKRLLEVTLSIRNTDPQREIILTSIRYYDAAGVLLESYLERPHRLTPLATTEIIVEQNDPRGGSGANFIVEWVAESKVAQPIVEAVMIGISGQQGLSFIRSGQVIGTRP